MDIRLLDGAKEDLRNGWFFYERQAPGLGDRFLDAIEALVLLGIGAEALSPVRVIAEAVDVLRFVLEGEIDQGIGFPIAWGDLPDRGLVGVEVPLAGRANALP
ncbi:MAG: hypothetical protein ACKO3F_13165, partial [Cyanobium sp.]